MLRRIVAIAFAVALGLVVPERAGGAPPPAGGVSNQRMILCDGVNSGTTQLAQVSLSGYPSYTTLAFVRSSGATYRLAPASLTVDGTYVVSASDGRQWVYTGGLNDTGTARLPITSAVSISAGLAVTGSGALADNTDDSTPPIGLATAAAGIGAPLNIITHGPLAVLTGAFPGTRYWLGAAGTLSASKPTSPGSALVVLGYAVSPSTINVNISDQGVVPGGIALAVNATRTACAAPCAVFFDVTGSASMAGATSLLTGGDYVGAQVTWDFDSTAVAPSDPHRRTIGFAAAHVFQTPGVYSVRTTMKDTAGVSAAAATTIAVTAMAGTTYYVATTGNDSNVGTDPAHPFATLAKGLTVIGTGVSVLLRRGDTFSGLSTATLASVTGPALVGAYTDSNAPSSSAPVLAWAGGQDPFVVTNGSDIRFVDLHVKPPSIISNGFCFNCGPSTSLVDPLLLRVEIEGSTGSGGIQVSVGQTAARVFVIDCNIHNFQGYGVYGASTTRFAMVGTAVSQFFGNFHGVRLQGCSESSGSCITGAGTDTATNLSVIAESSFAASPPPAASPFDAIALRGDNRNSVLVNNVSNRLIEWQPQNNTSVEFVQNGLAEGNFIFDPRDPSTGGGSAQPLVIAVLAKHIVIRNNLMGNANTYIAVTAQGNMPAGWTDEITIENNSAFTGSVPGDSNGNHDAVAFVERSGGATGTIRVENNVFVTLQPPSPFGGQKLIRLDAGTNLEDHNLTFAPNDGAFVHPSSAGDVYGDPLFVSTDPLSADFLRIPANSPAAAAGVPVPVYRDYAGAARVAPVDIGGYVHN